MNNNHIKELTLVISILIITLASFASYAYFTADVQGNDTAANNVITTGNMEITYEDGNVIGTTNNMIPGDSIEKHFSVKNTGTVDSVYDLYLNNVINTFNTREDLVYELISENGANINQTTCPNLNSKIASAIQIGVGQTHNYTLKITFKNEDKVQDDNQGALFSAKVDLEEKQNNIATTIVNTKLIGATDLEYDGTEDNNLRYIGKTPNNYIYFNCSTTNQDEMNDETCEKWRIIGVMNNTEDENGNKESRVKIMRNDILGKYSWDSSINNSTGNVNNGSGVNQWGESFFKDGTPYEGADLMRELNTDYLGNVTIGTDGKWINNLGETKYDDSYMNSNMPEPLNNNSINMIQSVKWYLGSPTYNNGNYQFNIYSNSDVYTMYAGERSKVDKNICIDVCSNDNIERISEWIGKVALIYPSDYGFSVGNSSTLSRERCLSADMGSSLFGSRWTTSDTCSNNSWIYNLPTKEVQWLLTPYFKSNYNGEVFYIDSYGNIFNYNAYHDYVVRPSLYLKSNVVITSGNGSETNPYKLTM